MISKELLNKVLNIEIVSYQMKQKNILAYEYNKVSKNQWSGKTFCNRSINTYEFAHKCKEWLENNTHWDLMIIGYEVYLMKDIWGEGGACNHKRFTTQREWFLNLFDACEYIMKLKEIK